VKTGNFEFKVYFASIDLKNIGKYNSSNINEIEAKKCLSFLQNQQTN